MKSSPKNESKTRIKLPKGQRRGVTVWSPLRSTSPERKKTAQKILEENEGYAFPSYKYSSKGNSNISIIPEQSKNEKSESAEPEILQKETEGDEYIRLSRSKIHKSSKIPKRSKKNTKETQNFESESSFLSSEEPQLVYLVPESSTTFETSEFQEENYLSDEISRETESGIENKQKLCDQGTQRSESSFIENSENSEMIPSPMHKETAAKEEESVYYSSELIIEEGETFITISPRKSKRTELSLTYELDRTDIPPQNSAADTSKNSSVSNITPTKKEKSKSETYSPKALTIDETTEINQSESSLYDEVEDIGEETVWMFIPMEKTKTKKKSNSKEKNLVPNSSKVLISINALLKGKGNESDRVEIGRMMSCYQREHFLILVSDDSSIIGVYVYMNNQLENIWGEGPDAVDLTEIESFWIRKSGSDILEKVSNNGINDVSVVAFSLPPK